ncbi:cystathionine gamma-synthase family protein [Stetteria hydrogenophila]
MPGFSTRSVHGHGYFDRETGAFIPPIYLTVVYEHPATETGEPRTVDRGTALIYGREENPTVRALERVLASLESAGDALAFNSGMAAISTLLLSLLRRGDEVVVAMETYGKVARLLEEAASRFGVRVVRAWPSAESIAERVSGDTRLVFVESVTNPTLKVIDVEALARHCRDAGATLVVDNTFATPLLLNPTEYGADYVVHSTTKYIAGHNDVLGGVVAGEAGAITSLWEWRVILGTIMQPFEAYLTLRGVKTLEARFERQSRTALAVAEFLSDHPRVEEVHYPGLDSSPYKPIADKLFKKPLYGGVLSFKIKGGLQDALSVVRKLRVIKPSPSFGGTESLITLPILTSAAMLPAEERKALGIDEGLLRLSIGLEDQDDIIEDLSNALG